MSDDYADRLATARAALAAGNARAAADAAQALLQERPAERQALALLANCGAALGEPDIALAGLLPLLDADRDNPTLRRAAADALNMRGARLRASGDSEAALAPLRRAVELQPQHRLAWFNAGAALADVGRAADARRALERHLELCPRDEEALVLSARLARAEAPAEAARLLAELRTPEFLDAALGVADALDRDGAAGPASQAYAALLPVSANGRIAPGLCAALGRRLALPAVHGSIEDLHAARRGFVDGLAALEAEWNDLLAEAAPSLMQLAWCNFKLAYQGEDDRVLQQRHAALVEHAAATLFPHWRVAPVPPRRPRKRIALLSSGWRTCTVGAYFGGWIGWLREAGYDVRLYQLGTRDAGTERLAAAAGHLHHHSGSLESLARQVRDDAPDLLLYPELGMDPRLMALATLRLAPRQAVGWGHPVTTGLGTMDAFISCAAMEPADAQAHYSERLLTLPGLGVAYHAPAPPPALERAALGLPLAAPLLLVPQSMFKLHPAFDALLATIAAARPELRIVLFRGEVAAWAEVVHQRLAAALAAAGASAAQLLWLPSQSRDRYLAINRACDLMLDVPQWSGGNTALDALASGLPLLTAPGRFMRGRQSAAMLGLLGVDDSLVVQRPELLPVLALALLDDAPGRGLLRERILAGQPALLDPAAAREAFLGHVAMLSSTI